MRIRTGLSAAIFLTAFLAVPAAAQGLSPTDLSSVLGGDSAAPAGAEARLRPLAVPQFLQVSPGQSFPVALDLRIAEGWAFYSPRPGESQAAFTPQPGGVRLLAEGLSAGQTLWPEHMRYRYDFGGIELTNNVYKGRTILYVPVTVAADAAAGEHELRFDFRGQICGEGLCISLDAPQQVAAQTTVRVGEEPRANPAWDEDPAYAAGLEAARPAERLVDTASAIGPATAGGERATWVWLSMAVVAGLVLNIMPCVLPVIPLRLLSVVEMAGESRRRIVSLGLAFAGGMLVFFVALAAVSAILREVTGAVVNLNEHFQYAPLRVAMAMVLVALAANFFGVFNVVVPAGVSGIESDRNRQGHLKSAGMGLMMAVLATPCSFAILAGVLAWAQFQPTWLGSLAFVLIGVGMAAPHALLAAFPGAIQKIPRPGRWMELFKQTMGFLLLPVALWLIATLAEDSYPFWVAGYAVLLVFCLWMWANWVRFDAPLRKKVLVRGLAVAIAVAGGYFMLRPSRGLETNFAPYRPGAIAAARQQGRPTLVKFTASWCTACLVVDRTVYDDPAVAEALRDRNVAVFKADVTKRESQAAEFLYGTFGTSPPLTVLYPPGENAEPIRLVGEFSSQELLEALEALPAGGEQGPVASEASGPDGRS